MLPNVWSVEQFKQASSRIFSTRSNELQAIDKALAVAHTANLSTDSGTDALLKLLEAISAWKRSKIQQGKTSGRARAVDELLEQVSRISEEHYKRKINDPRTIVQASFQKLAQTPQKPALQPKPPVPAKGPPVPIGAPRRTPSQDRLFDFLAQILVFRLEPLKFQIADGGTRFRKRRPLGFRRGPFLLFGGLLAACAGRGRFFAKPHLATLPSASLPHLC